MHDTVREAKPTFFASPAAFGKWLARYGADREELVVGYWKVATGKASMTWAESVEQALVHGWIDGVRHSLGEDAYTIRFTPRKPGSNWSVVNVRTATRLIAEGRMAPAGLAAFEAGASQRKRSAPHEQLKAPKLAGADLRRLQADAAAWRWFRKAAPSYQRACAFWVQSAKRQETRDRRLAQLIEYAGRGEVLPQYRWSRKPARRTTSKPAKSERKPPKSL